MWFGNFDIHAQTNVSRTNTVIVYHAFKYLLENEVYKCYGKPIEKYKWHKCKLCFKYYVSQLFKNGKDLTTIYNDTACKFSPTGKHDNLKLSTIEPCGCDDDFDIGASF